MLIVFYNMDIINNIRNKYDRLANKIEPHITLAFPFKDDMSNEDLINKLSELLKNYSSFEVTFNITSESHSLNTGTTISLREALLHAM